MVKEIYYETTPTGLKQAWKLQWMQSYISDPLCAHHSIFPTCEQATAAAIAMVESAKKQEKSGDKVYAICIERVFVLSDNTI